MSLMYAPFTTYIVCQKCELTFHGYVISIFDTIQIYMYEFIVSEKTKDGYVMLLYSSYVCCIQ